MLSRLWYIWFRNNLWKWLLCLWQKIVLHLCPSVWTFARHWPASRPPSPSPWPLGAASPSLWIPEGRKLWPSKGRRRKLHQAWEEMPGEESSFWRKNWKFQLVMPHHKAKMFLQKKDFKCEQCENTFKSENGLKIHIGRAHKIVNSTPSTPERLRQQLEGSVCISASPLLDTSREEFSLNNVAVEEKAKPPPSLRPLPLPPSPHKCPPFHPCSRRECKLRVERQRAKEALHKTCTNCDEDLYITMCCAEDKGLCEDCCNDLGVCSWGVPHANYDLSMHRPKRTCMWLFKVWTKFRLVWCHTNFLSK